MAATSSHSCNSPQPAENHDSYTTTGDTIHAGAPPRAATTTALRIVDAALRQGHNVTVFAYEGAVNLTMKAQQPHPNPVKGTSVEQEEHPTTKDWTASLFALAHEQEAKLDWINCGLCVDERGAGDWLEGPRRGSPKDFYDAVQRVMAFW